MRVIEADVGKPIYIGHVDDNESLEVVFDVTHLIDSIGVGGDFYLRYKRPIDHDAYPVTPDHYTVSAGKLAWTLSSDDLVHGTGEVQIRYVIDNTAIMSMIYTTICQDSLGSDGEVPEPIESYMDYLENILAQCLNAAQRAEQAASTFDVKIVGTKLVIG